jgi:hypothetical protein
LTRIALLEARFPEAGGPALPRRTEWALFFFALALRLPLLPQHHLVEGDGVHYASLARAILAGDLSGLANPYWSNLWPAVIAATSSLTRLDVVSAGRLAALLSGACIAPASAALAARTFGRTTGILAGLLIAGHPWLVHLSTLVLSESFAALLLMGLLLAAQRAASGQGHVAVVGVLGGLAVVTRPESYASIAVAVLYLLARSAPRGFRWAASQAAVVAGLVVLFLGARAILVHRYYGEWDFGLGVKGTANLFVGMAPNDSELERLRSEMTPEGEALLSKQIEGVSVLGFARAHPGVFLVHVARNTRLLAVSVLRVFPQITPIPGRAPGNGNFPPALVGFAAVVCCLAAYGNVRGWLDPRTRLDVALFSATGALFLLGLAALVVHDRLVLALVPLFLVFTAHGLVGVSEWLAARWDPRRREQLLAGVVGLQALVCLALLLAAPELDYLGERLVQRTAGEWLRSHYPQTTRIMTPSPFVGFYFYDSAHADNELGLPWANEPGLVVLARRLRVDLIVAPEWHIEAVAHPAAANLTNRSCCLPDLRHIVTVGDEERGRVFVYEVLPLAVVPSEPSG